MVFSRRNFLCGATATTLLVPSFMSLLTTEASAASDSILVILNMAGGTDGYGMLVPYGTAGYAAYQAMRPTISLPDKSGEEGNFEATQIGTTPKSTSKQFALHPSFGPLQSPTATNNMLSLYRKGQVAFVAGIGIPTDAPARTDHQMSSFYQATGTIHTDNFPGFGSSIANGLGNPQFALVGFGVGSGKLFGLAHKTVPVSIGGSLDGFSVAYWRGGEYNAGHPGSALAAQLSLSDLNMSSDPSGAATTADFAQSLSDDSLALVGQVKKYAALVSGNDYVTTMIDPASKQKVGSRYKEQLQQVARLILAGAPGKVYSVGMEGFDTHGGQVANHQSAFAEISEAVAEFHSYLAAHGAGQNVTLMSVSDFGRRPHENGNHGTDHGTSSVSFLSGPRINGGIHGTYPTFDKPTFDADGNFVVAVDFRAQLAQVLQQFGISPTSVLAAADASQYTNALPNLFGTA